MSRWACRVSPPCANGHLLITIPNLGRGLAGVSRSARVRDGPYGGKKVCVLRGDGGELAQQRAGNTSIGPMPGRECPVGQSEDERGGWLPDASVLEGPGVGHGSVTDAVQQAGRGEFAGGPF